MQNCVGRGFSAIFFLFYFFLVVLQLGTVFQTYLLTDTTTKLKTTIALGAVTSKLKHKNIGIKTDWFLGAVSGTVYLGQSDLIASATFYEAFHNIHCVGRGDESVSRGLEHEDLGLNLQNPLFWVPPSPAACTAGIEMNLHINLRKTQSRVTMLVSKHENGTKYPCINEFLFFFFR